MSGDLRLRIAQALADHEQADLGMDADRYPAERWLCCADAVIAALGEQSQKSATMGWRADVKRQARLAVRTVLEAALVLSISLFALWVSDWAQRETDSRAVGWAAGFGVILGPLVPLAAWRRWRRR